MESFTKWGTEKRKLDEILGAFEKYDTWLVKKWDNKLTDLDLMQAVINHQLHPKDEIWKVGSQNWTNIKDWLKTGKVKRLHQRMEKPQLDANTKWWVSYNKQQMELTTEELIQRMEGQGKGRKVLVRRKGYLEWKPYEDKDVQDELKPFVKQHRQTSTPYEGSQKLAGTNVYYMSGGNRLGPVKFEDLPGLMKKRTINDRTSVWIGAHAKAWVPLADVKNLLPDQGQTQAPTARGFLGKAGKLIGNVGKGLMQGPQRTGEVATQAQNLPKNPTPPR